MRSNCRSLFFALALSSLALSSQLYLHSALAEGKGGPDAADSDDGPKCPPSTGAAPGPDKGALRGRHFHGGFGGDFGRGPLDFSMLNLSEEQKTKISNARSRNAGRAKELRQQIMAKKMEMRDLMFSADATNEQIMAKRNEMKNLIEESETLRMNDFLAMRSVLTAEQRKKWADAKLAEMKAMSGRRFMEDGDRPGPPGGPPPPPPGAKGK